MFTYILSLLLSLFDTFSSQDVSQVENSIRINGSCRDNTTKDYLKQSVVYAVFKSSRKLISKSDETGYFEFQIPDSTKYLSFEVEKYHTATIPVNFIGKIASNSKFPVFVEMSLKDSLLMPLRNQLTICLTVPDSMDIDHRITHFNSTAFSELSFHKNFNNGKHWPFYYTEGFRPGNYRYTASSPEGHLYLRKEMTLSPGFNFMDVHIAKPEEPANVITTLPSQATTVYFVQSSYELTNETKTVLDSVSQFLMNQPDKVAHVTGYTDNVGEQEKNLTLSEYRARTVENYLKQRGIKPSQMNVKWKGSNLPVASNDSEQTKIKNRRVEIQILPK